MQGLPKYAMLITGFAALTWLLEKMAPVLIPFVFAIFMYYNILPVMRFAQRKWNLSHYPSLGVALGFYAVFYVICGMLIASGVKEALQSVDVYRQKLSEFNHFFASWLSGYGINVQGDEITSGLSKSGLFSWVSSVSGGVMGILGTLALVAIFLVFILLSPISNEGRIFAKIEKQLTRYVIAKAAVSVSTGLFTGLFLGVIGVDMAALFGLLSFLLNFIPNVGSIFAILLPLPIAWLEFGFGTPFWLSILVPGGAQFLSGNFIEPKLLGQALDLHPIVVLLALVYWGMVWGVPGMFLSVPLLAVLKIVMESSELTKRYACLLAGEFPRASGEK